MELNQLPEGHEGEQQRRTEFKDEAEKLAYDADNLIALAKRTLGKEKVSVRDALDFATRKGDDLEALRKAIAIRLKAKPAANESEVIGAKYVGFIDGLNLPEPDAEKLKEMVSDANYQKAVEAAQELDSKSAIPSKAQILEELMKWDKKKLKEICEIQVKPRVVIETNNSFDEQVDAMNEHKRYTAQDGQTQDDAYVNRGTDSPYINAPKSKKVVVSITDGEVHPPQLKGVSAKLGERRANVTKEYAKKGHKLPSKGAMAALYQMSLKEAEESGDNSQIIDNWEDGDGTVTLLDPSSLTKSALVAYSDFNFYYRQVVFGADSPDIGNDGARGRASVQVLEI